jgi:hypothetical protein
MRSATASSKDNVAVRAATALWFWIQSKNKLHVVCWLIAMLVAATEALWEGYVVFMLAGWPAFILSAVSFFLVTYFIVNAALQRIIPETLTVMKLLRQSKNFDLTFFFITKFSIVSGLFSLAMILSIFTFRNTGIWAAGFLFTADGPSWIGIIATLPIKYWVLAIAVTISAVVISILFWIDFAKQSLIFMQYLEKIIKGKSPLKKNQLMGQMLCFLGLGIGSHFITQSFVYMLERGVVAFAQVFFHIPGDLQVVSVMHPLLHAVIHIALWLMIFKSLWIVSEILYQNCRTFSWDKSTDKSCKNGFYIFIGLLFISACVVRAIASGYAMRALTFDALVAPFWSAVFVRVADDLAGVDTTIKDSQALTFGRPGYAILLLGLLLLAGLVASIKMPLLMIFYISIPVGFMFLSIVCCLGLGHQNNSTPDAQAQEQPITHPKQAVFFTKPVCSPPISLENSTAAVSKQDPKPSIELEEMFITQP